MFSRLFETVDEKGYIGTGIEVRTALAQRTVRESARHFTIDEQNTSGATLVCCVWLVNLFNDHRNNIYTDTQVVSLY